jgi:HD-GYP domain-containing protein (c-di-GMP phosphodiesterase class II)
MITQRAYRAALPLDAACRELRRCAGAQFDPAVVDAFLAVAEGGADERELDAAESAADHIRSLLAAA